MKGNQNGSLSCKMEQRHSFKCDINWDLTLQVKTGHHRLVDSLHPITGRKIVCTFTKTSPVNNNNMSYLYRINVSVKIILLSPRVLVKMILLSVINKKVNSWERKYFYMSMVTCFRHSRVLICIQIEYTQRLPIVIIRCQLLALKAMEFDLTFATTSQTQNEIK